MEHGNGTSDPQSPSARGDMNKDSEFYEKSKMGGNHAFDRSESSFSETYGQALEYSRNNPGKATLIAFGIGIGVGLLLQGSARRSRASRYGEPIVDALSKIALEFVRTM
jgi:hypothetical protein